MKHKTKSKKSKRVEPLKIYNRSEHAEIIVEIGGISITSTDILSVHIKIPKFILKGGK